MNQHAKFSVLIAFMGVVTFLSSYLTGGKTLSFMAFGNVWMLPLISALFVMGLAALLYGLSMWWGPYALRFIADISKRIYEDFRSAKK
jgi:hypothetical protein